MRGVLAPVGARGFFGGGVVKKRDLFTAFILFRAAWGALKDVLEVDQRELAAIFTVQTAGEALNHNPHLHGLLADGHWKDGVFFRLSEVDLKAIEDAFAKGVLAQLHK